MPSACRTLPCAGGSACCERREVASPACRPLPGLILPQKVKPVPPTDLAPDAVFHGVGWAALHSDLAHPENDLMVAFKSSPFGGVSHSYADQNSFIVLKNGHALARPGGIRYPQHGSPFHTKYTQQTIAHSSILVDGHGQISRNASANGRIVAFESTPHLGYACGDATAAYGKRLTRFRRHVLLVRPSLVCIVDDLQAPELAEYQWLMHACEKLRLDQDAQTLVSHRGNAEMKVRLITPPASGFPRPMPGRWHRRRGSRRRKSASRRNSGISPPRPRNAPRAAGSPP